MTKLTIKKSWAFMAVLLVVTALALHAYLTEQNSTGLPNINPAPEVTLRSMPNFTAIQDVKEKKERFFNTLYPLIEEENRHLLKKRAAIIKLREQEVLTSHQSKWLNKIMSHYAIDETLPLENKYDLLLRRVDYIPPSLVLTQAAIESGWGSSRFTRKANNLFGQWCFEKGCGVVPSSRDKGKQHELASFKSVNGSIRAYLKNLNTHFAYIELRETRAYLREADIPLTGLALAKTLTRYSEEGDAYVDKVSAFIKFNKLSRFNTSFEQSLVASNNE